MLDLSDRKILVNYLKSHGLYTKKKLGQNFLVDRGALDKIVEAAELRQEDCVIEIGPGLGVLTEELVKKAGKVIAVEIDQKLAELLAERLSGAVIGGTWDGTQDKSLEIISSNILDINIAKVTESCSNYKVVANIPYYITSKILRFFLEAEKKPELIVLLTQKEVAERICAKPGEMSVLSVSVQYYGRPEIIGIVSKTSFFPMPEVDSAILRIKTFSNVISTPSVLTEARNPVACAMTGSSRQPEDRLPQDDSQEMKQKNDKQFFRCVKFGFASRRKTLLNNLSAGCHLDKKTTLGILEKVGLTERTRAQELSIEKWQELCMQLTHIL